MSHAPVSPRRFGWRAVGMVLLALGLAAWMTWRTGWMLEQLQGRSIAGWNVDSVRMRSIAPGRMTLDRLHLSQQGQGGSRIELELQGVQVDFSLFRRQVESVQVSQARLLWRVGVDSEPRPWPRLLESPLPLSKLSIDHLLASVELGPGRRWQLETPLQLQQQGDGRLILQAQVDGQPLQLVVRPGPAVIAELQWPHKPGQDSLVEIYVTYAISRISNGTVKTKDGAIGLRGKFPLELAGKLSRWVFHAAQLPHGTGQLGLQAQLELGANLGQWTSLAAQLQAEEARLEWGAASDKVRVELQGPASLQLRPGEQGIEWSTTLQPELQWKINGGSEPGWIAAATLSQAWRIEPGPRAYKSSLPFELRLPGREPLALRIDRLQLDLARDGRLRSAGGQLRLAAIQLHPDWPATALASQWTLKDGKLALTGQVELQGKPLLRLSGDYALQSACGQGRLDYAGSLATLDRLLQPRPKNLQPLRLKAGEGSGWLTGQLCLRPGKAISPVVKGQWQMKRAEIGWDKALASGLDLELSFEGMTPSTASLSLRLESASLAGGLALSPASLKLGWTDNRLQLHRLDAGLLDGRLSTSDVELEVPAGSGAMAWRIPLTVSQIDLEQLLKILDVPGLSGNGRLSGQLPLVRSPDGVEISGGRLSSQQPGQLRYVSQVPVADNPGLQALRDFRYSQLGLELDYRTDGKYALDLRLDGHNPEFYSGHPIAFQLKLDGALPGLFQGALLSGDFDAYILKQLQQGNLE